MAEKEEAPKTVPLTDVFSKVLVTEGQAVALLSDMASDHSDRDPTLMTAFQQAITDLTESPEAKKQREQKEKDEKDPKEKDEKDLPLQSNRPRPTP